MTAQPPEPLLRGLDAVVVRRPSLEEGVAFQHDALGHEPHRRLRTGG